MSLLSTCSATSSRRWLMDPVRRSRRYNQQQPASSSFCLTTGHPAMRFSLGQQATFASSPTATNLLVVKQESKPMIAASRSASRAFARTFSSSNATVGQSRIEGNNSNRRVWEVALSTCAAFVTSAALILSFPSKSQSHAEPHCHQNTLVSFGQGPQGGGGGGDGGPGYYSMVYAAAVPSVADDIVHSKEKTSPALETTTSQGRKVYDVSIRAIKGARVTMEDEYFVADGGRFAAVFDGHGGGGVSTHLKRHLHNHFTRASAQKHWEEDDRVKQPSLACQVAALRSAFHQVEDDVLQDDTLKYQGSTAVAVVLHESEEGHRTLLSANVGDSRAILSRRGRALDLTRDHKPNEEREKARILSMGETIEWDRFAKVHRVRNLSLSRAIGDRYAKPVVSGEVEIKHFPVVDDGDEFILLASDGLWDVMTSQDVVSYVHNHMEKELKRQPPGAHDQEHYRLVLRRNMAKFIAREAVRRGSGDNVCVLIVWLNDIHKSES